MGKSRDLKRKYSMFSTRSNQAKYLPSKKRKAPLTEWSVKSLAKLDGHRSERSGTPTIQESHLNKNSGGQSELLNPSHIPRLVYDYLSQSGYQSLADKFAGECPYLVGLKYFTETTGGKILPPIPGSSLIDIIHGHYYNLHSKLSVEQNDAASSASQVPSSVGLEQGLERRIEDSPETDPEILISNQITKLDEDAVLADPPSFEEVTTASTINLTENLPESVPNETQVFPSPVEEKIGVEKRPSTTSSGESKIGDDEEPFDSYQNSLGEFLLNQGSPGDRTKSGHIVVVSWKIEQIKKLKSLQVPTDVLKLLAAFIYDSLSTATKPRIAEFMEKYPQVLKHRISQGGVVTSNVPTDTYWLLKLVDQPIGRHHCRRYLFSIIYLSQSLRRPYLEEVPSWVRNLVYGVETPAGFVDKLKKYLGCQISHLVVEFLKVVLPSFQATLTQEDKHILDKFTRCQSNGSTLPERNYAVGNSPRSQDHGRQSSSVNPPVQYSDSLHLSGCIQSSSADHIPVKVTPAQHTNPQTDSTGHPAFSYSSATTMPCVTLVKSPPAADAPGTFSSSAAPHVPVPDIRNLNKLGSAPVSVLFKNATQNLVPAASKRITINPTLVSANSTMTTQCVAVNQASFVTQTSTVPSSSKTNVTNISLGTNTIVYGQQGPVPVSRNARIHIYSVRPNQISLSTGSTSIGITSKPVSLAPKLVQLAPKPVPGASKAVSDAAKAVPEAPKAVPVPSPRTLPTRHPNALESDPRLISVPASVPIVTVPGEASVNPTSVPVSGGFVQPTYLVPTEPSKLTKMNHSSTGIPSNVAVFSSSQSGSSCVFQNPILSMKFAHSAPSLLVSLPRPSSSSQLPTGVPVSVAGVIGGSAPHLLPSTATTSSTVPVSTSRLFSSCSTSGTASTCSVSSSVPSIPIVPLVPTPPPCLVPVSQVSKSCFPSGLPSVPLVPLLPSPLPCPVPANQVSTEQSHQVEPRPSSCRNSPSPGTRPTGSTPNCAPSCFIKPLRELLDIVSTVPHVPLSNIPPLDKSTSTPEAPGTDNRTSRTDQANETGSKSTEDQQKASENGKVSKKRAASNAKKTKAERAKREGWQFFTNILYSRDSSDENGSNRRAGVQDLLDKKINSEEFVHNVLKMRSRWANERLIPFLNATLPHVRRALNSNEIRLRGIQYPAPFQDASNEPDSTQTRNDSDVPDLEPENESVGTETEWTDPEPIEILELIAAPLENGECSSKDQPGPPPSESNQRPQEKLERRSVESNLSRPPAPWDKIVRPCSVILRPNLTLKLPHGVFSISS